MTSSPTDLPLAGNVKTSTFQRFFNKLSHGGYLLFPAALLAVLWANTNPAGYNHFWHLPLTLGLGDFTVSISLAHCVNDVFMTFFFFTVGLEIKRELLVGALSKKENAILPVSAALGGMFVPAIVFLYFNQQLPEAKGWGIPMATDIAFSLAVLSTLGARVPFSVRIFLTAFAIADDLGAVLIIAIFYTSNIDYRFLLAAIPVLLALTMLNRFWVRSTIPYLIVGALLWATVTLSGLHATVAGVLVAMFIPARGKYDMSNFLFILESHANTIRENIKVSDDIMLNRSHLNAVHSIDHACLDVETPLQRLEIIHAQWVSMVVLPLFALANMGLVLRGIDISAAIIHPVTFGITLGLFVGKPIGVFGATWLTSKLMRLPLADGFTWTQLLGVAFLGGIGFTMSLFISGLSYVKLIYFDYSKIGIICGSMLCAIVGYTLLRLSTTPGK